MHVGERGKGVGVCEMLLTESQREQVDRVAMVA